MSCEAGCVGRLARKRPRYDRFGHVLVSVTRTGPKRSGSQRARSSFVLRISFASGPRFSGPAVSSTAGSPCSRGEERNTPSCSPSSPSRMFACRSRFEPRGAAASLTCSALSRSRPIADSSSSRQASSAAASVTSTPDTQRWQESRQMPSRGCRPIRSWIVASSSIERPIVPPAPAEFSIRIHVSSVHSSSTCSSAGSTCSSPASSPLPRCEPTWKTTPSAPIAQATSVVFRIAATERSYTSDPASRDCRGRGRGRGRRRSRPRPASRGSGRSSPGRGSSAATCAGSG